MGNKKRPKPIRLSNRTAIGLRRAAQRVRSAWLIAMGVMTMIVVVIAVYLGFYWLPAVPLTLLVGAGVVTMMFIASRSQYLMLISQAICTEAASRQMEERRTEQKRREKAIEQLAAMRADVSEAYKRGRADEGVKGEESILFDLLTGREPSEEEILASRRMQEDDEMYAASYEGDEDAELDAQEDMYPPKKNKFAQETPKMASAMTGSTRPVNRNSMQAMPAAAANAQEQNHRRRRRSAPTGTSPLQLIRNDQAK